MFSGKFCEIPKNTFFTQHLRNLLHCFISQRNFIYLFRPSFVRKMDKIHNFAVFLFWHLYSLLWMYFIDQNINTWNHISSIRDKRTIFMKCRTEVTNVKKRSWKNIYKKIKKNKENEKVANRKLGNLGNLGNIIPSFLISKFSILPYSQNRKLGFKNLGKKFPSFLSFRPGQLYTFWMFPCCKIHLFLFGESQFHGPVGYIIIT